MKTINLGQWAFRSRMTVNDAVLQCRLIQNRHRASRRFTEFLANNFGDDVERHGLNFGLVPDWACSESERLLDYDRQSPHGFTSNTMTLAFARAEHLPAAA